jgi:hypothetical protein
MANERERCSPDAGSREEINKKRRENRYNVPDGYQQYIKLRVKSGNEFVPAILGNFSRSGILFECPLSFSKGMHTECVMAISLLFSREISFGIEVRYCYEDHGSYIMGASIDTISDGTWFDVFVEAHDFIVLRQGSV